MKQNFTHLDANHTALLPDMHNMNRNPSSVTGNREQMFLLMVTCRLKGHSMFYHWDSSTVCEVSFPFKKKKKRKPIPVVKSPISWGRSPQCCSNVLRSWKFWTVPKRVFLKIMWKLTHIFLLWMHYDLGNSFV